MVKSLIQLFPSVFLSLPGISAIFSVRRLPSR